MITTKSPKFNENDKRWFASEIRKKRYEFAINNFDEVVDWMKNEIENNWNLYGLNEYDKTIEWNLLVGRSSVFLLVEIPMIALSILRGQSLYYTCDHHGRIAFTKDGRFYYRRDL
jgi:hypothetical protein